VRRIVIDTDPGQDDAIALLLALASPAELDVVAVTATAGNVPLALTTRNSLIVVELAGRSDVPVYAGASGPLLRDLVTAEYVHGKTGLDGPALAEPTLIAAEGHAVDAILGAAEQGPITMCTLGPLTNLAMALAAQPSLASRIDEIVMMGGGFSEGGNVTPAAEFNIYVDPHAADVVLTSGVPITMMPLDVTHQVLAGSSRIRGFEALNTDIGKVVAEWLRFFDRYDSEKYGIDGAPLHDPCVIAYLLEPELFAGRLCNVTVETGSELTMGMTVVDWWSVTDKPRNVTVMRSVDPDRFFDLLIDRIGRLGTS
jgi:purine nucleosidase